MTGLALAVAITLALAGAVCFAFAAVHQHTAVRDHTAVSAPGLGLRSLVRLARRPRWLAGMALGLGGGALALVALSLAPLSVVQPIGVLSVPFALLIHTVVRRHPPHRSEVVAVTATVLGTAAFVWFVAGTAHSAPPRAGSVITAAVVIGAAAGAAALVGRYGPTRWSSLGWAVAGATLYGLGTTMIKSIFLLWTAHPGRAVLADPAGWIAAGVALISFPLGVWAVQHAFLAGSPQVVVGALTVIDPLVCVVLGFGILGEGGASRTELAGMAVAAAVALVGVAQLARAGRLSPPGPESDTDPSARHRSRDLVTLERTS